MLILGKLVNFEYSVGLFIEYSVGLSIEYSVDGISIIVATSVLLLEYDKTPVLTVVIKLDKLKEASVVSLFGISAKEITLGMKLATLGVETVVRAFPLPSLPNSATIEEVKLVPAAWELNALRIPASVIRTLLFPS
jgi:hypothetical protein